MEKMDWRDTPKKAAPEREDRPIIINDQKQNAEELFRLHTEEAEKNMDYPIYVNDGETESLSSAEGYAYGSGEVERPIYQPEAQFRLRNIRNWNLLSQGVVCLIFVFLLNGISKIPQIGPLFLERYKTVLVYDAKDKLKPIYLQGWNHIKRISTASWNMVASWFATEIKEALAPPAQSFTMTLPVKGRPEMLISRDESGRKRLGMIIPKGTDAFSSSPGVVREVEACAGGWRIVIEHSRDWTSVYYPILVPYVVQGQWVNGKEIIGRTGLDLDRRLGYDMFFWEVRYKDASVNPMEVSGREGFTN